MSTFSNSFCRNTIALMVISYIQFCGLLGWMVWLAICANNVKGMRSSKAYRIPAHNLISGRFDVPKDGGAAISGGLTVPERPEVKRAPSDSTGFYSTV